MRGKVRVLHVLVPWVLGVKAVYVAATFAAKINPAVVAGIIGAAHVIGGFLGVLKWMSDGKQKRPEFLLSIFGFSFGVGVASGSLSGFPVGSPVWFLGLVVTWVLVPGLFWAVTHLLNPMFRSYESNGRSTFATGFACWFAMFGGLVCMRVYPNGPDFVLGIIGPVIALVFFGIAQSLSSPLRK